VLKVQRARDWELIRQQSEMIDLLNQEVQLLRRMAMKNKYLFTGSKV
jgi:hypothetical protein